MTALVGAHYTIDNPEEGIYYVIGDILPIQILVTNRLSPEKNLWLYSLTDTLEDMSVTRRLLEDYKKNKEDQLYQAVMEIIVKANENRLKEGKRDMCNALLELMKDELDEKKEEGILTGFPCNIRISFLLSDPIFDCFVVFCFFWYRKTRICRS